MSEEELIETLKEFEKSRVDKLKEPSKNLFYAIMKIADERDKYKIVLDKIKKYITSYESINTIQELDIPENNIGLDEETFIEMVNRYMKVHDKILELLEEIK